MTKDLLVAAFDLFWSAPDLTILVPNFDSIYSSKESTEPSVMLSPGGLFFLGNSVSSLITIEMLSARPSLYFLWICSYLLKL